MTTNALNRLAQEGEGLHLEFKHKAADPQKILREIAAFSNAQGGTLLIGVDDDGTVRGVKDPQEEIYAMQAAIERYCKPQPVYQLEEIPVSRKRSVLVFAVEEAEKKPMFVIYNERRGTGRAYVRVADRSVQASRELRKILKMKQKGEGDPFVYGDTEQALMQFLQKQEHITLVELTEIAQISQEQASQVLVNLTASRVLQIHPGEQTDHYSLFEYQNF